MPLIDGARKRVHAVGLASALSGAGDAAWLVALPWAVAGHYGARGATLIFLCLEAPQLALAFYGGAVADRRGPWNVAIVSDIAKAAVLGLFICALWQRVGPLWLLCILCLTFAVIDAFHVPSLSSLLPTFLPADRLGWGNGLLQAYSRTAVFLGASLGGILVSRWGVSTAAALNLASFLASSALLFTVRVPLLQRSSKGASEEGGVRRGFNYLLADRHLLGVILLGALVNLLTTGPLSVGLVLLVRENAWSGTWLGVGSALVGLGAVMGSWFAGRIRGGHWPLSWAFAALCAQAGLVTLIGFFISRSVFVAVLFIVGAAAGFASVGLVSFVQGRTAESFMGRVMAAVSSLNGVVSPLSVTVFGLVCGVLGARTSFISWGIAAFVLLSASAALLTRRGRYE